MPGEEEEVIRLPWIATTPLCFRRLADRVPPTNDRSHAEWLDWLAVLRMSHQLMVALIHLHVSMHHRRIQRIRAGVKGVGHGRLLSVYVYWVAPAQPPPRECAGSGREGRSR